MLRHNQQVSQGRFVRAATASPASQHDHCLVANFTLLLFTIALCFWMADIRAHCQSSASQELTFADKVHHIRFHVLSFHVPKHVPGVRVCSTLLLDSQFFSSSGLSKMFKPRNRHQVLLDPRFLALFLAIHARLLHASVLLFSRLKTTVRGLDESNRARSFAFSVNVLRQSLPKTSEEAIGRHRCRRRRQQHENEGVCRRYAKPFLMASAATGPAPGPCGGVPSSRARRAAPDAS